MLPPAGSRSMSTLVPSSARYRRHVDRSLEVDHDLGAVAGVLHRVRVDDLRAARRRAQHRGSRRAARRELLLERRWNRSARPSTRLEIGVVLCRANSNSSSVRRARRLGKPPLALGSTRGEGREDRPRRCEQQRRDQEPVSGTHRSICQQRGRAGPGERSSGAPDWVRRRARSSGLSCTSKNNASDADGDRRAGERRST